MKNRPIKCSGLNVVRVCQNRDRFASGITTVKSLIYEDFPKVFRGKLVSTDIFISKIIIISRCRIQSVNVLELRTA